MKAIFVLVLAASPALAMEYSGGVPGAEVGRLVRAAMEAAGIRVSPSPARLGKTLVDVLKG